MNVWCSLSKQHTHEKYCIEYKQNYISILQDFMFIFAQLEIKKVRLKRYIKHLNVMYICSK